MIKALIFLLFLLVFVVIPWRVGALKHLCIAVDQLVNAYFKGWPDETLSSRAWRWEQAGKRAWPRRFIDCLFFWDRDHCKTSFESERTGRHLPPEARAGL